MGRREIEAFDEDDEMFFEPPKKSLWRRLRRESRAADSHSPNDHSSLFERVPDVFFRLVGAVLQPCLKPWNSGVWYWTEFGARSLRNLAGPVCRCRSREARLLARLKLPLVSRDLLDLAILLVVVSIDASFTVPKPPGKAENRICGRKRSG